MHLANATAPVVEDAAEPPLSADAFAAAVLVVSRLATAGGLEPLPQAGAHNPSTRRPAADSSARLYTPLRRTAASKTTVKRL
jgi:hypothetical protein